MEVIFRVNLGYAVILFLIHMGLCYGNGAYEEQKAAGLVGYSQ